MKPALHQILLASGHKISNFMPWCDQILMSGDFYWMKFPPKGEIIDWPQTHRATFHYIAENVDRSSSMAEFCPAALLTVDAIDHGCHNEYVDVGAKITCTLVVSYVYCLEGGRWHSGMCLIFHMESHGFDSQPNATQEGSPGRKCHCGELVECYS